MAKTGVGSWAGKINVRLARGEVTFKIDEDENGEYKIDVKLPGALRTAKISFFDLVEDKENRTVSGKGKISVLPGRNLEGSFTFDDDSFTGEIKAPVVGKIAITEGRRVD